MAKKYQIFVSSTYLDLVAERQAVTHAILDMGHIPAGMELFPAADVEQLTYIKKVIDECDYYILVLANRYGSVDSSGVSYTEREYDYATSKKIPVLAFMIADAVGPASTIGGLSQPEAGALLKFKNRVMRGRLVRTWSSALDLKASAIVALQWAFSEMPQVGWLRADVFPDDAAQQILRYRTRIDHLAAENNKLKQNTPVFTDIAGLETEVIVRYSPLGGASVLQFSRSLGDFLSLIVDSLRIGANLHKLKSDIKDAIQFARPGYVDVSDESVSKVLATFMASGYCTFRGGEYWLTPSGNDAWVQYSYHRSKPAQGG